MSLARSWIKKKPRQAADAEAQAAPLHNLPHAVRSARVVQQQRSRAWMRKWTSSPRSKEQDRLLQEVLHSVPQGTHQDMVFHFEDEDLLRAARKVPIFGRRITSCRCLSCGGNSLQSSGRLF